MFAVSVLVLAMAAMRAVAAADFASHVAHYRIELWRAGSTTLVQNIDGMAESSLRRNCRGWVSEEEFAIYFTSVFGDVSGLSSRYDTWESLNGNNFIFSVIEKSALAGDKNYQGSASIERGSAGEASIYGSDEANIRLVRDTLFPIQYMQAVVAAAKTGGKIFRAPLFVGGGVEGSRYFVSTLIGNAKTTDSIDFAPDVLPLDGLDGLLESHYWPMRLAYFDPQSKEAVPEYEVEFMVQENGIIHGYIIDYGDFSVRARLHDIERLAAEEC